MRLKDSTLNSIKKNYRLRRALMDLHEVSEQTIMAWVRKNYPKLIEYNSLQLTSAYLKKDIDELVIKEEHDFKPVV